MAQLQDLLIQGVRSVGIENHQAQTIHFLKPLTIISGPNGTGKTTTIEALNFITTGAFPSGSGRAWVHSIDMVKKPRVDASVKLRFLDPKGRTVVVTKRMNLSKGRTGKIQFKSDDFTILVKNKDGSQKSLSAKVIDVKKEMLNLLGVSSAILEHVMFCHQEQSTWPLSEPKELKSRFDEIFEVTKYVKAIEVMNKTKKEYTQELQVLSERERSAAFKRRTRLERVAEQMSLSERRAVLATEGEDLEKRIQKAEREVDESRRELLRIEQTEKDRSYAEVRLKSLMEQLGHLRCGDFPGTREQLQREIGELKSSSEFADVSAQKERVEKRLSVAERELTRLDVVRRQIENESVELKSKQMHREQTARELCRLEDSVADVYGVHVDENTPLAPALRQIMLDRETEVDRVQVACRGRRESAQHAVDDAMSELAAVQAKLESAVSERCRLGESVREARYKLDTVAKSAEEMASLQRDIERLEKKLGGLEPADEETAGRMREQRRVAQEKLDSLRPQLAAAEKYAEKHRELARKESELSVFEGEMAVLEEKHRDDIRAVFGKAITFEKINERVCDIGEKTSAAGKVADEKAKTAERDTDRTRQAVRQLEQQQREMEKEAEECRQRIETLSGGVSPSSISSRLSDVRRFLAKARKELAPLDASSVLYTRWANETRSRQCCPLCDRGFSSRRGAEELIDKLVSFNETIPAETTRLEKEVTDYEEEERSLAQAAMHVETMDSLSAKLSSLSSSISSSRSQMASQEATRERLHRERAEVQELADRIARLQADASLMDSHWRRCDQLAEEIYTLKGDIREVSGSSSSLRADELKVEVVKQQSLVDSLVASAERLQASMGERNRISEELHSLRARRLCLGEDAANMKHLQDVLNDRQKELSSKCELVRDLESQLPAKKRQVEDVNSSRASVDRECSGEEERVRQAVRDLSSHMQQLKAVSDKLQSLEDQATAAEDCARRLEEVNGQVKTWQKKISDCEADRARAESANASLRRLEDQLTRMEVKMNIEKIEKEMSALEWNAENKDQLQRTYKDANKLLDTGRVRLGEIRGQVREVDEKLSTVRAALQSRELMNAEQQYRNTVVERCTVQGAIEDLARFCDVLDQSVLSFHSEKMGEINEILDDLWRKVYNGGDIHTIKIRTDEASGSDKRKSYDYRVVMVVEQGVEIDMRDRCSAGQKMLACLLIRIALADVFGGVCGAIALDEPTTNLDAAKVDQMAVMLNELIAERRGKQFQLIVITHDDRLVSKLLLGSRPEYSYRLGKNDCGVSYIERSYSDGHRETTSASDFV